MTATLLLNSSYEPLRTISWQRAITLSLLDKIDVLETYAGQSIRSARQDLPWPAVARLRGRVSWRSRGVRFSRINVYRRDNFTCQYCCRKHSVGNLTFDHVLPKSQGGATNWTNIVTACLPCNQHKGARTPEQAGMKLLRTPKKPQWFQQDLVSSPPALWKPYLWI